MKVSSPSLPPSAFDVLDPVERAWRARACVVLWLRGFHASAAWRLALSRDPDWSSYLRDVLPGQISDRELYGRWLDRRVRDAHWAFYGDGRGAPAAQATTMPVAAGR